MICEVQGVRGAEPVLRAISLSVGVVRPLNRRSADRADHPGGGDKVEPVLASQKH